MKRPGIPLIFAVLVLSAAVTLSAQEVTGLAGGEVAPETSETTYSWQIDYRQRIGQNFALSTGWINEGHVVGHHRDGFNATAWGVVPFSEGRFSIAFGLGAYRYYDTQALPNGDSADVHGWAPLYGFSATYHTQSAWFYRLSTNVIVPSDNISTTSVLLGVGYDLRPGKPGSQPHARKDRVTGNEATVFIGKSIVNTLFSESAVAAGFEYRRGIATNLDWTLSWINEGDPEVIRRNGIATQLWLVDAYLNDRLTLGMGAGVYYFADRKGEPVPGQDTQHDFAGLVSPTISYRFGKQWLVRFTWNRVVTEYDRDADVFLLGLGVRWGGK